MTEPMLPAFIDMVGKIGPRQPKISFLSNLSGDWITPQEATDPSYWGRHLRGTVRFGDGLHELLSNPARILLEVGPGETLTKLAQRHPDVNPERINFVDLHALVLALDGFDDDPKRSGEKILEAIQAAWIEEAD